MTDYPSKGERTRQVILDAAYCLFIEQGYHATSMRQIAEQAGLALGGIYNHFESKEQIFDQVLLDKHPYRQVLEILHATPGATMEAFTKNAARAMMTEISKRPDFLKLVFVEVSEFKGKHAPLLYQTILPQFLPLVQRFTSEESQLRDLPPRAILLSFVSMLITYYITEFVINPGASDTSSPNALEQYLDIFYHGILKPETP